jgi:hypothetical protein
MWCRNLGLDDGDSHGEEANSDALDRAAGNEGGEARSKDLDKGTEEVDETAQTDSPLSTDHIAESAGNEGAHSCGGLQTGDGYARDGGIDFGCAAVGAAVVGKETLDEDGIDKQARHDTCHPPLVETRKGKSKRALPEL